MNIQCSLPCHKARVASIDFINAKEFEEDKENTFAVSGSIQGELRIFDITWNESICETTFKETILRVLWLKPPNHLESDVYFQCPVAYILEDLMIACQCKNGKVVISRVIYQSLGKYILHEERTIDLCSYGFCKMEKLVYKKIHQPQMYIHVYESLILPRGTRDLSWIITSFGSKSALDYTSVDIGIEKMTSTKNFGSIMGFGAVLVEDIIDLPRCLHIACGYEGGQLALYKLKFLENVSRDATITNTEFSLPLISVSECSMLQNFSLSEHPISCISFSKGDYRCAKQNLYLAASTLDGIVTLFSLNENIEMSMASAHTLSHSSDNIHFGKSTTVCVNSVTFSHSKTHLFITTNDGSIRCMCIETGQIDCDAWGHASASISEGLSENSGSLFIINLPRKSSSKTIPSDSLKMIEDSYSSTVQQSSFNPISCWTASSDPEKCYAIGGCDGDIHIVYAGI